MTSRRKTEFATPDHALASYLDDLLQTAVRGAREAEPEPPAPALSQPVGKAETKAPPKSAPAEPDFKAPVAPPPPVEPEAPAPVILTRDEPEVAKTPEPEPEAPPSRPPWSERPFECLIFRVAGLQLAVPLVLLGAIHRLDGKVKTIPGRPRWYMGMLPSQDQNLRVVDTAEWIMAGRVPEGARDQYRFVIRLDNSEWALACDDVAQSFTLDPDEVRWRSGRSKRPWLAGTVIKHMCALIDVGTMASLLARAEREHRLQLD
ncbi:MAG: CheW domain-containing protein [Marinobacter sp.]|uniref:CheW domain-containing protein n=1 Tax=Marinobacter sp. TaxID=50741 RepID=UPI00299DDEDD|nr:CheW domain-containing protein [Marinobacter sp.]MDX1635832.1 CheW domain-containing protein [Marinobacter sp.]